MNQEKSFGQLEMTELYTGNERKILLGKSDWRKQIE